MCPAGEERPRTIELPPLVVRAAAEEAQPELCAPPMPEESEPSPAKSTRTPVTVPAPEPRTASFDGERVRLEWNWKTEGAKSAGGARTLAVTDITAVTWQPTAGVRAARSMRCGPRTA